MLAARKVSSVEVTEVYLRRIEAMNSKLNAYLTVDGEGAMAQAREADRRLAKGDKALLLGVPIAIKDLELTKGLRTTMGSLVYKDFMPDWDGAVSERVKRAGAVVLGKTNTPEFGFAGTNENRLGDACRNPWDVSRTSGGSSGGSAAAVASGLCALATGSDGGGSIRIPASFCGIYGIKPTLGRIPRFGGLGKPAPNLTSQSGPLTRTVRDSALLLQALAGPDERDVMSMRETPPDFVASLKQGVKGLRVAWSGDLGYAAVEPEVEAIARKGAMALGELGCEVEEPGLSLEYPLLDFVSIFSTGGYASYGHLQLEHEDKLTDYVIENFERGKKVSGLEYARSLNAVMRMTAQVSQWMDKYDLLVTPTMAVAAFAVGKNPAEIAGRKAYPRWDFMPYTPVFNLTGQPAASAPCGFTSGGLPVGLHIIGRRGAEATVLRASAALESARPWSGQAPAVS